jgi:hypothetical protein
MGSIFYQLYQPCGLFNQITSLEVAVGLANRYKKQLILHNISNPPNSEYGGARVPIYSANYKYNKRSNLIDCDIFPNIADLIDWENKDSTILINDTVDSFTNEDLTVENLMMYYSSLSEKVNQIEENFSEGRQNILINNYNNVHLKKTLGYYSRFFFDRNTSLDKSLLSVKFKIEYYELAEKVAKSIGPFNGAHFRLTDHKGMFDPNNDILDSGISKINNGRPIVMCTDQPNSELIKNSSYNYLLLDKYILNNFYSDFKEFKFKEEVSFGILNNLVMHYSQDFIGSPGSTYTGYIHRGLNQKRDVQWKIFGEEEHLQDGPYSWNGYNNKDTFTKQWWREWKESKLWII